MLESLGCISYYSYIKPQPSEECSLREYVVYRTIPTSNHNLWRFLAFSSALYIVLFLHQTTTDRIRKFIQRTLYIVLFLHQTTTDFPVSDGKCKLYIVLFLHQTTTNGYGYLFKWCCISYYSYIKPQLPDALCFLESVVYRTIPTSNHNLSFSVRKM